MTRDQLLALFQEVLTRQGKAVRITEDTELSEIGFRSLDFSELAVRVEMAANTTLAFDAAPLRAIRTVRDVVDFLVLASGPK